MLARLSGLDWLYELHDHASDELFILRLSRARQDMHIRVITICQTLTERE
jgi:hypothetical protein